MTAGLAAKADVLQAETQLKTTEAQAIDVGVQRAQLEHAIALLIGKPAAAFSIAPGPLAALPPAIPVGVPSILLERRPDIAAAERRCRRGQRPDRRGQGSLFPDDQPERLGRIQSTNFANWLTWPSRFWSVGPAISADPVRRRACAGRRTSRPGPRMRQRWPTTARRS